MKSVILIARILSSVFRPSYYPTVGMLILLLLLCLKIVKLDQIREVSDFFLKRLSFFFLPPAIGLMLVGDDVKSQWPLLLFLCIVITIVTMVTTGWTVQLLSKKSKDKN